MASRPLQALSIPKLAHGIRVRYSPDIVHFYRDASLLAAGPLNPRHAYMDSWLEDHPKGTLRWTIQTSPSAPELKKAVLRNALRGKWNKMFRSELAAQGYDKSGRIAGTGRLGLTGTLEMTIWSGNGFLGPEEVHGWKCRAIIDTVRTLQNTRPNSGPRTPHFFTKKEFK